jgi:branched-chain amino acid transport system ATP-binding protein
VTGDRSSIELAHIDRRFGGVLALSDVSTVIQGPGVVGLIGPNGSGKTTLLAILSGLLAPTRGEVIVNGRRLTNRGPRAFFDAGVARTFQNVRLAGHLRVWENLVVSAPRRESLAAQLSEMRATSRQLGVPDEALDDWPSALTSATQRKVEICRALLSRARILLLDEPSAGLTGEEADELVGQIRRIGKTSLVIVVEHNMQVLYSTAARILVLIDGVLAADGDPEEVSASAVVRRGYMGLDVVETDEYA